MKQIGIGTDMNGFKVTLEKYSVSTVLFIKVVCVSTTQSMHKLFYPPINKLFQDKVVVVWIEAVTSKLYQLRSEASKFMLSKLIEVDTPYRINAIKLTHTLEKPLKIVFRLENISFFNASVIDMVILSICKLYLSFHIIGVLRSEASQYFLGGEPTRIF